MRVAVELDIRKRRCMPLDRLTDPALAAVELHGALDLERRGVGRVTGDTD